MKDKKLQVFVSSTFTDLVEERQAAVEAVLSSGNIPAGMELFSAGDESQMTVIKRWIDESDVYLLILGGRYGSIEEKTGKSYTHLEYEYALELGKPLFAIVINENALNEKVKQKGISVIEQDNSEKLKQFRNLVLGNLVKFYEDKKDIKIAIHEILSDFVYRKELIGWIRGDNSVNTAKMAEEIMRLTKENSEFREKIELYKQPIERLYSGYTYEQLKEILEEEKINTSDRTLSAFDFIKQYGKQFASGWLLGGLTVSNYSQLFVYKLLRKETAPANNRYIIFFTEDGHDFYLRTIK
jgi:hypothetical protein